MFAGVIVVLQSVFQEPLPARSAPARSGGCRVQILPYMVILSSPPVSLPAPLPPAPPLAEPNRFPDRGLRACGARVFSFFFPLPSSFLPHSFFSPVSQVPRRWLRPLRMQVNGRRTLHILALWAGGAVPAERLVQPNMCGLSTNRWNFRRYWSGGN